jgi:flagellin
MSINSINTNIAAFSAQANIGRAASSAASSIARLSSGNRIVRSSDDVAALSAGTSLRTNVTTLRVALVNSSQGSSLLQVADGALSQLTDILQRQQSIAVQAGSGSLTSAERGFLNQEFQNLTQEIDRIVDNTNFNGVTLLDGSLAERVDASTNTANATQGEIRLNFTANITTGQTLVVNGTTITEGAGFALGGSTSQSIDNLVAFLNNSTDTNLNSATYARDGDSLVVTSRTGGSLGDFFTGVGTFVAFNVSGSTGSTSLKLFNADINAANINTDLTNAVPTAAEPFKVGEVLTLKLGAAPLATPIITYAANANNTLSDIVQAINSQTSTTGISGEIIGTSGAYNILLTADTAPVSGAFNITADTGANTNAAGNENAAANTVNIRNFGFSDESNVGLARGDTIGVGTVGDNLLTDQVQTRARVEIVFPSVSNLATLAGASITVNDNNAATTSDQVFTFSTNAGTNAAGTEITIGATLEETLNNAVAAINSAAGNSSFQEIQGRVTAFREGNSIVIESNGVGNVNNFDNTGVAQIALTDPNALGISVSNTGNLNNGSATGISTSGVVNSDFVGQIQGFGATFDGTANQVDLQITVGSVTYSADNVTTNPTSDATVRFLSADGGFFDLQLRGGSGSTISNQADADTFAGRLDAAFASVSFVQNRDVSSYQGSSPIVVNGNLVGSLAGTSVELSSGNFDGAISIDDIIVNAPAGSSANGSITFVVNGEEFRGSSNIGSELGANTQFSFVSVSDANSVLTFNTGNGAIDFSTQENADAVRTALQQAFGVGNGSAELQFQVGITTQDTLSIGLSNVSAGTLFNGAALDVLTAQGAATASDAISAALDAVTSVRAEVGAIQSRFNFASANIQSSLQNQDAARAVLLDTDVAAESTAFATAQVQLQAGISVLAQANLLPQNLLKLIG